MMRRAILATAVLALLSPSSVAAVAQDRTADQRYCAVLLEKYLRYAGVLEYQGNPSKVTNDNAAAYAQARCQAGDTESGIQILERKLKDARLDLPPRS